MTDLLAKKKHKALKLVASKEFYKARKIFSEICTKYTKDAESWCLLGAVNGELGYIDSALDACVKAVRLAPSNPQVHYNIGKVYFLGQEYDEALSSFKKAVLLKADYELAYYNLGVIYELKRQWEEALENYRHAVNVNPLYAEAINGQGRILNTMGDRDGAVSCFRRALSINPYLERAHSNILFCMNEVTMDPQSVFVEHRNWYKQHGMNLHKKNEFKNYISTVRKLRIGYVSPDFRNHPVKFFIESLFENYDRNKFEIICYSNVKKSDSSTIHLKSLVDDWRDVRSLTDAEVYGLVTKDRIDILVDLAGHTDGNRLLLFCMKPAPIQITYLGYPNTTGLDTMDYRLTDSWADPPGMTEHLYTESLVRLPYGFLSYKPMNNLPDVGTLPFLQNKHITFGSFNSARKITGEVVRVWSQVLNNCPGSKLLLKNAQLEISAMKKNIYSAFESNGIEKERIEMMGAVSNINDHLAMYSRIDIALDTFPYNGTTTTCEALVMGVPVISLVGKQHAGRVGLSLLAQIGLGDFAAKNVHMYVQCAVSHAQNTESLSRLRAELRDTVISTNLCNGKQFANSVEEVYRTMWAAWLQKHC